MMMQPKDLLASGENNKTEVKKREGSSSALRMSQLQKQASRFIKAQKSHEKVNESSTS